MKKLWLVLGGYAIAFGIASAAVAIRFVLTNTPEAEAESGMYAFGDAAFFIGVFGLFALIPTGAALYFLRKHRALWISLAAFSFLIALTGVAAVAGYHAKSDWSALAPLRILGAPLLALNFALFAVLSRHLPSRVALAVCSVAEIGVFAYGLSIWLT